MAAIVMALGSKVALTVVKLGLLSSIVVKQIAAIVEVTHLVATVPDLECFMAFIFMRRPVLPFAESAR